MNPKLIQAARTLPPSLALALALALAACSGRDRKSVV